MPAESEATYAIVGDVHGHLQLALCTLARWQRERGRPFSAVLLVGDVGTFTEESQLDNATHRHARENPCELEFLTQWSAYPPRPWIDAIFQPAPEGLGLCCPIVMVHGNHEGFAHLERLYSQKYVPESPLTLDKLPDVDPNARIKLLPSGWTAVTPQGHRIGGVGGMERGQRRVKYHEMAYINESAVEHLMLPAGALDVLITHQGPAIVQGDHGSPTLDILLEFAVARFWFHGHSTPVRTPQQIKSCMVVPLGDVAFHGGVPGTDGWAILEFGRDGTVLTKASPEFLRSSRQKLWSRTADGLLVHPDLAGWIG